MNRTWKNIKWIFEPDGALRDIYVQEVSIKEWSIAIDLINSKYEASYSPIGENHDIDKEYVIKYMTDKTGEIESKSCTINLEEIKVNCHFFLEYQIEFDLDPKEINSLHDFKLIEKFMIDLSKATKSQVTLTDENSIGIPLMKIDFEHGINRVLKKSEAKEYWNQPNSLISKVQSLKTNLEIKLAPNNFKEKLFKSAEEPYKSTKKDKNVW